MCEHAECTKQSNADIADVLIAISVMARMVASLLNGSDNEERNSQYGKDERTDN